MGDIFNFLTLKIWEIDLMGTCYIHADFQTAELEVPSPIFLLYCYKLRLKLPQKQLAITLPITLIIYQSPAERSFTPIILLC